MEIIKYLVLRSKIQVLSNNFKSNACMKADVSRSAHNRVCFKNHTGIIYCFCYHLVELFL